MSPPAGIVANHKHADVKPAATDEVVHSIKQMRRVIRLTLLGPLRCIAAVICFDQQKVFHGDVTIRRLSESSLQRSRDVDRGSAWYDKQAIETGS